MKQRSINISDKIWNKAKKKYGQRKISKNIQRLLQEDLDIENDKSVKIDLVYRSDLSQKRKEAVRKLIAEGLTTKVSRIQFGKVMKKHNIYSRKDHIRKAFKSIGQEPTSPYYLEDQTLYGKKSIGCSCGSNSALPGYYKHDGCCPRCGKVLFSFLEEQENPDKDSKNTLNLV